MKKKVANIIVILIVLGIGLILYRYSIYPNSYKYETAVKNGDVVIGASGKANVDKLYSFIKNVESKKQDKIRITSYTKEGDPIIRDLEYDGKVIRCTTDNTRDRYSSRTKDNKEYTKIVIEIGNNNTNYKLIDETGKYQNNLIFQE